MAEFYCVLTGPGLLTVIDGKPVKVTVSPADGRQAVLETFAKVKFRDLSGREVFATLVPAVKAGMRGRLIHDWMHAEAATRAECDFLVTLNARDFVRMVSKKIQLVAPTDYFAKGCI